MERRPFSAEFKRVTLPRLTLQLLAPGQVDAHREKYRAGI
jgi:hypothetical protein